MLSADLNRKEKVIWISSTKNIQCDCLTLLTFCFRTIRGIHDLGNGKKYMLREKKKGHIIV